MASIQFGDNKALDVPDGTTAGTGVELASGLWRRYKASSPRTTAQPAQAWAARLLVLTSEQVEGRRAKGAWEASRPPSLLPVWAWEAAGGPAQGPRGGVPACRKSQ